jgi:3-hydroxyisobutyrate dehydrogenase-like beta-hydroxyacid dehydrogenase
MFRSIMIKGIESLMLESMLAASEYGVEARVLASLKETFPSLDWERLSGYLIERVVSHGQRRAEEMREVAATLEAMGLEPVMAAATARRQQWLADLKVKHPRTEDRAALLAAIRDALGELGRKKAA